MTPKRKAIKPAVRDEVLREAGYKCANPICRNIMTLQLHHILWVKDGGGDVATNLLALCGHCHDMHTQGHIPDTAIEHWKGMLHALNHAFDRISMDLLLYLHQRGEKPHWYSGDGVLKFAGLFAAGLVQFGKQYASDTFGGIGEDGTSVSLYSSCHEVILSQKGKLLVEAWKKGDANGYKMALSI
jgi:hypothetical protein